MNVKNKIERIVSKNPEIKDILISLENPNIRDKFTKIVEKDDKKVILVGKNVEQIVGLYELSMIVNIGYPHITQVTTVDLLDSYVDEDLPSLSTIRDDVVIIRDSRAYVPNKQKSNMIMQVFEQNDRVIYYYKGTSKSFTSEHQSLVEYAKENGVSVYGDQSTGKIVREDTI